MSTELLRPLLASGSATGRIGFAEPLWAWLLETGAEIEFVVEWRAGGQIHWSVEAPGPVPGFDGIECVRWGQQGRDRCSRASTAQRPAAWDTLPLPPDALGALALETAIAGDERRAELDRLLAGRLLGVLGPRPFLNRPTEEALGALAGAMAEPMERALLALDGSRAYLSASGPAALRVEAHLGAGASEALGQRPRRALPVSLWSLPRQTNSAVFGLSTEGLAPLAAATGDFFASLFSFRGLESRLAARVGRWASRAPTRLLSHAHGVAPAAGARPEFRLLALGGDWLETVAWLDEGVGLLEIPAVSLQVRRVVAAALGRRSSALRLAARPAPSGVRLYEASFLSPAGGERSPSLLLRVSPGSQIPATRHARARPSSTWLFAHQTGVTQWFSNAAPPLTQTLAARAGLEDLARARGFASGFLTPSVASLTDTPLTFSAWNAAGVAGLEMHLPLLTLRKWLVVVSPKPAQAR